LELEVFKVDNQTILVIDDDRNILEIVKMYLMKEGYTVSTGERGDTAVALFHEVKPMLVVLDVMLPGMDGWTVLHQIREESDIPVIMLTAKGDTVERVQGLDLGADDYIVKPFDAKELLARIKAVLRRTGKTETERVIALPNLVVSLENYSVTLLDKVLEMPPKEIELLYFLTSHEGKVFTREQLLEQVWGFDFFGDSRTVDVHVKRIREKIGENDAWQIKTVWGVGYKFELARE
jgi:DNA-binding response OmpR family regulator